MFKYFKFIFIFALILNSHANAKPVPPGAGTGDVAANILFLVDSSISMRTWIGGQGVSPSTGVTYDAQGRILIGQNARRNNWGLIRYLADGTRDTNFGPEPAGLGLTRVPAAGCTGSDVPTTGFANERVRKVANVKYIAGLSSTGGVGTAFTNENVIIVNSRERRTQNRVFGFSEDLTRCLFVIEEPGYMNADFDVKTIGGTPYIFMTGWGRGNRASFKSCNLETLVCERALFNVRGHILSKPNHHRISVNNEGTMVYLTESPNGDLVGHTLTAVPGSGFAFGAEARRCTAVNSPTLTSQVMFATGVAVSPDDSNIVYISSRANHAVQKLELTDTTCTVVTSVGRGTSSIAINSGSANALDADKIAYFQPWGLSVTSDRILTSSRAGYVDEYDEDLFTAARRNTTWLQQMGGPRIRRWDGVKQAIDAIVNDTTLTTGAYFGFGHWNAGEAGGRNDSRGGVYCHHNNDCTYYQGWSTATHPNGTSTQCDRNSCLNVGVSPRGAGLVMSTLNPLGLEWGTDSHAFSQIAEDYFMDLNGGGSILDPQSTCQLNYVIVIGDGAMSNTGVLGAGGETAARMERLRKIGVKSLYVAYGGGITGTPLLRFQELARIGSSDLPAGTTEDECNNDDDCERAIEAATPTDLKTELTTKIRQIIADKLAFTAPSITATIQQGGSLYQAQFAYEQYGEWRGTILRKKMKVDQTCNDSDADTTNDCVEHDTVPGNAHGNWNAATKIRSQSSSGSDHTNDSRKIWTAWSPGDSYKKNLDNFNASNSSALGLMFDQLGYTVQDYHHSTSDCDTVGADTTLGDEVKGLINFMKGNDYFNYGGECNVTEVRDHVMGDIYHSQLIEVGVPEANIAFTDTNEEAYYRATNNYQAFMSKYANRENVIYAGSNSGMLHAINAKTGEEQWGFIPPFIGAKLPQIINKDYDGRVNVTTDSAGNRIATGGTNAIFGVDGSPVVHDVHIYGYNQDLILEGSKTWRTLMFVPYGRGGSGFSVLDVTEPGADGAKGPIHMFSIYNDRINQKVLIADVDGVITEKQYNSGSGSLLNSQEGSMAADNFEAARTADEAISDTTVTQQNAIAPCVTSTDFKDNGTNSCYQGRVFHFPDIQLEYPMDTVIPEGVLGATELVNGIAQPIIIQEAVMKDDGNGPMLRVTFGNVKTFNANQSALAPTGTNQINIAACIGGSGLEPEYDYSQLGETWSTPKIIRMPISSNGRVEDDRYVAVMGAGMAKNDACAGSAIYLVDLEGHEVGKPGRIFGADVNGGPITIVDTSPNGITSGPNLIPTPNGSDISNSIPASPIVITPDTAPDIPWRGALVYINDLEGKITKINLSNNTKGYVGGKLQDGVTELYDQTTLFSIKASEDNGRYSYFSMDAGLGLSDGGFWLFGSTGNFTDLGGRANTIDNILYGVQDVHYPYFNHLNNVKIPKAVAVPGAVPMVIDGEFLKLANQGANDAANIDDAAVCIDTSGNNTGNNCPLPAGANSWVAHLEKDGGNFTSPRTYRKASAPPTLFGGQVYFPIYQPPPNSNKCDQGNAFICAADDECGTNTSAKLQLSLTPTDDAGLAIDNPNANACGFVRKGILSELVIFGDKLYANVAGPSADSSTLFSILSIPGEIITNKGGWRDSSF